MKPLFPIYVLIGTKAQYIKMAPLLRLMQEMEVSYYLIDTGQHARISEALRAELAIKAPDAILARKGNIDSLPSLIWWMTRIVAVALLMPSRMRDEMFPLGKGLCFIHGDTASTLMGLILAKRAGMKVAHMESGLRSFNLLRPFPEELVRIVCMRKSDYLFAPSAWAADNLARMKVRGRIFDTGQNTNVESLHYALNSKESASPLPPSYCVATIHRAETIFSKRRLEFVVGNLLRLAGSIHILFIVHDATRHKLRKFGMSERVAAQENISCFDLMGHARFINILANADYVITDGGSIQEECYYLGVPCLVLRSETERLEGIHAKARLCAFDQIAFDQFLGDQSKGSARTVVENRHPSQRILEIISTEVTA